MQTQFMDKYYLQFEDVDENRLIYTDIHREYVRDRDCLVSFDIYIS